MLRRGGEFDGEPRPDYPGLVRRGLVLMLAGTACLPAPVVSELDRPSFVLVAHQQALWRLDPPFSLYNLAPDAELLLYDGERAGYAVDAPGPIPVLSEGGMPLPRPSLVVDATGAARPLSPAAQSLRVAGRPCLGFDEVAAQDLRMPGTVRSLVQLDERRVLLTYSDNASCRDERGNPVKIEPAPTMVVVDVDTLQKEVRTPPRRGTPTAWALPSGEEVWLAIDRSIYRLSPELVVTATESLGIVDPRLRVLKLTGTLGQGGLELFALVVDSSTETPSATVFRRDPQGSWADLGPNLQVTNQTCHPNYEAATLVLTAAGRPRFTFRGGTVYEQEERGWKRTVLVPDELGACRTSAKQFDGLDLLVVQSTRPQGVFADLFRNTERGWVQRELGLAGAFDLAPWNGAAILSGDYADGIDTGYLVEATLTDTLEGQQFRICPGVATGRPTPLIIHRLPNALFVAAEGRGCSAWVSRLVEKR